MPRGKFVNHKGRNRHFTNPEELEEQRRQEEKTQQRKNEGSTSSTEKDDKTKHCVRDDALENGSESETNTESESESETRKAKGVENLIQIENPNRIQKKTKKLSDLNQDIDGSKRELSRREREQLEKEKAHANYLKLHAAGKTDEARADLARLAIIKQQREEAAKRREDEKKQKELAQQKKTELAHKALGKKS